MPADDVPADDAARGAAAGDQGAGGSRAPGIGRRPPGSPSWPGGSPNSPGGWSGSPAPRYVTSARPGRSTSGPTTRSRWPTGGLAFAKAARGDLGGVFEAEARGLRWLADAHAVPLPEVVGWDTATLAVTWLPPQAPDQHAAEQFGRDLAVLHASGAERFGSPWPGFIATLPLGDRSGDTVTVAAEATAPGPLTAGAAADQPGHADQRRGRLGQPGTRASGCCRTCAGRRAPGR